MSIYSPTVYTNDASSPDLDYTNMNKLENAVTKASQETTPITDFNRYLRLKGNNIPQIPDNLAGITYSQDAFSTVDSWAATGGTASVSGGFLLMTYSGTSGKISRTFTSFSSKLIRFILKTNVTGTVNLYGTVGGTADTLIASVSVSAGIKTTLDAYVTSAVTVLYLSLSSPVSGNIIYVDTVYIGSGVYDTPVYDMACCNRMSNSGVLPVRGLRGFGMQFLTGQYLAADNPVIGKTGTIAVKLRTYSISAAQRPLGNRTAGAAGGIAAYMYATTGVFNFQLVKADTTTQDITVGALSANTDYSLVLTVDGSTAKAYKDGTLITSSAQSEALTIATTNLHIGRMGVYASDYFNGVIYDVLYDNRIWTIDDAIRYSNGDDANDCQQKSINQVANAIKVCDSKGNIRQPGLPVYADNTTAISGGLVAGEQYRTSTGSLMVVY